VGRRKERDRVPASDVEHALTRHELVFSHAPTDDLYLVDLLPPSSSNTHGRARSAFLLNDVRL
jgi:hypothetical protein